MQGNKFYLLQVILLMTLHAAAQNSTQIEQLPINLISAANDTSKPIVFYITGDGGWNNFSKNLSQAFANKGYPVIALNAKEYFWKKKTALQSAVAITRVIKTYQSKWKRKNILLLGYSFGADVMPFIFNLLPPDLVAQVVNINLLSPSSHTDFEIHILDMFGAVNTNGWPVVASINKISGKPITIIFGNEETNFPKNQLTIKNYIIIQLNGGHHYDGDESKVCNTIVRYIPKS